MFYDTGMTNRDRVSYHISKEKQLCNCYHHVILWLCLSVFNDGTTKQLLCLGGTIPVPYKGKSHMILIVLYICNKTISTGNTYNIPVAIWLLETHPANAPMVFVRPTSDMQLKISKHVDHNGKVYMPYLHVWSPVILCCSEACPVLVS